MLVARQALKVSLFLKNAKYLQPLLSERIQIKRTFHWSNLSQSKNDRYTFLNDDFEEKDEDDHEEDDSDRTKEEMSDLVSRYLHIPGTAHQVLLIQPFIRYGKYIKSDTNADLMLAESLALVETLNWKVVETIKIGLESFKKKHLFGTGNLELLENKVITEDRITAVFISLYQLTPQQRIQLEHMFKVPVIDRYHLVLQIFYQHARTSESKMQVALAEIPYLKNRLTVDYEIEQNMKHSASRKGETYFEKRKITLNKWQGKIKKKVAKLRTQRVMLRQGRKKLDIPTVAVIGYTNCGKTSLIKSLTGASLEPMDKLFATLDVSCHATTLPDDLSCIFVDTVGFISDIPTSLIASFSSTLEDALDADILLHVRDVSHPDEEHQVNQVMETLRKLNLPKASLDKMITVGNKIDKIDSNLWKKVKNEGMLPISATEGYGVPILAKQLEKTLIQVTDRKRVKFKVRMGGEEYSWLYKTAAINQVEVDSSDENFCHLTVTLTTTDLNRFKSIFIF